MLQVNKKTIASSQKAEDYRVVGLTGDPVLQHITD